MKDYFALLIISCFLTTNLAAQDLDEKCPFLKVPEFNVFISGYADTIQGNGLKARIIDARSLTYGFILSTSDTDVHIRSFQLVFDDSYGNLYSITAKGSKLIAEESETFSMKRIAKAKLITIDNITVEYKGKCFVIPGQLYYAK